MHLGICNVHKCRYLGGDVVKRMKFDTTFGLTELGPPEYTQAEIDGCRIEGVNLAFHFKVIVRKFLSGNVDEVVSKFFEDLVVT